MLLRIRMLLPNLVKEYNLYAYETETGYGQRHIPFRDDNFILLCRQINDCTPTQSMQIVDFPGNMCLSTSWLVYRK